MTSDYEKELPEDFNACGNYDHHMAGCECALEALIARDKARDSRIREEARREAFEEAASIVWDWWPKTDDSRTKLYEELLTHATAQSPAKTTERKGVGL